jgi:hypothetical protein
MIDLMKKEIRNTKPFFLVILVAITSKKFAVSGDRGNVQSACELTGQESRFEQDRILNAAFSNGDLLEAFRCGQALSSLPGAEGPPIFPPHPCIGLLHSSS